MDFRCLITSFLVGFICLVISCKKDDDSSSDDDSNAEVVVQFTRANGFDIEGNEEDIPQILLEGSVDVTTTVTVSLVNTGTASGAGVDFNFDGPLVVTIPSGTYDGSTNSTLPITGFSIVDDTEEEETESLELRLSNPTGNASLGNITNTTYSIIDNDGLTISFSRITASGKESSEENLPQILVVGTVQEEIVVTVTDNGSGSATLDEDYVFTSPIEISIPEGVYDGSETSNIPITGLSIIDDDIVEPAEFFELELSAPTNEVLGVTSTRYEISGLEACEGGVADSYPCSGYDLLGRVSLSEFSAGSGNDIWGWTDAATGREFALVGLDNGTAFVEISGDEPIYLGKLPTATSASPWRDVKVYGDHVFIVSEANNHGIQVFNLGRLRFVSNPPVTFSADATYSGIGNAHNIVINEEMGFAYPVGTARSDAFNGGVHFIDVSNPTSPNGIGGYGSNGYTHDAQVVTYNGPDSDYVGREIFIGSNETQIAIVDISDKSNPQEISSLSYSQLGYTHQGWFTEDQRYFLLGDELDETDFGFNSRTLVFDFSDLDAPTLHFEYQGPTAAIDHNGYVLGDEFYLANYTAGMRVIDISDIENERMTETGFFDTYPQNNTAQFDGAWSVYPYFESGKIVINDINSGLFVIQKSN
jgi:choice-of-anchor B domain-containing protein